MGWMRCIAVLLLVWSQAGGTETRDLPLRSAGDLRFFVDLSAFRGPEGYTRQEVALLLDASQLRLREQAGESVGEISLVAVVLDTLDNRVAHRTWVQPIAVPDTTPGMGAPFKEVFYFDLKPGGLPAGHTDQRHPRAAGWTLRRAASNPGLRASIPDV